jgi:hypothetical protein
MELPKSACRTLPAQRQTRVSGEPGPPPPTKSSCWGPGPLPAWEGGANKPNRKPKHDDRCEVHSYRLSKVVSLIAIRGWIEYASCQGEQEEDAGEDSPHFQSRPVHSNHTASNAKPPEAQPYQPKTHRKTTEIDQHLLHAMQMQAAQ